MGDRDDHCDDHHGGPWHDMGDRDVGGVDYHDSDDDNDGDDDDDNC